jgi:uncharacterized protein DUF3667
MARKRIKSHYCANCGYHFRMKVELINYCPNCGQENHNPRKPLLHYLTDLVEGFFHFDNKTWRSLKTLLLKPGTITKDFIENRRARYTPPVRMFLLILAFFVLVSIVTYKQYLKTVSPKEYNNTYKEWIDTENPNTLYQYTVPFFWNKKESVSIARLRQLENMKPNDIGYWLDTSGYPSGMFHRLYFERFQKLVNRNLSFKVVNQKSSNIDYAVFIFLIPVAAIFIYLSFYRRGLLYYDCLILALHSGMFIMLVAIVISIAVILAPRLFSGYLPYSTITPLLLSFALNALPAFKKVFGFNWVTTIIRLLVCTTLVFLIYSFLKFLGFLFWI